MERTIILRSVSCLSGDIFRSHWGPHPADVAFIAMSCNLLSKNLQEKKEQLISSFKCGMHDVLLYRQVFCVFYLLGDKRSNKEKNSLIQYICHNLMGTVQNTHICCKESGNFVYNLKGPHRFNAQLCWVTLNCLMDNNYSKKRRTVFSYCDYYPLGSMIDTPSPGAIYVNNSTL